MDIQNELKESAVTKEGLTTITAWISEGMPIAPGDTLVLVEEVKRLQQERDNWIETARLHLTNEEYYRAERDALLQKYEPDNPLLDPEQAY